MRSLFRLVAGFTVLSFGFMASVQADTKLHDGSMLSDKPLFIVSYIEVGPSDVGEAASLIRQQTATSRKESGNLSFESLQRNGRKNHFVILETWSGPEARSNHAKASHTVAFRKALQPLLYNPYDERPHVGLVAADPSTISAPTGSTLYVITHVDVIPPETFPPCKRQVNENGPCGIDLTRDLVKASRKHNGNMRYDALTQSNRANHMTTVEMWASESDQEKHTVTSVVKNFRDALSAITPGSGVSSDPLFVLNPMTGSLYDERFYRSID